MMSNSNTPTKINMATIEESWSPLEADQKKRDDSCATEKMGKIKVRSLSRNSRLLRGGDWLYSDRKFMTLAVAWKSEVSGKQYGLTVNHPFAQCGRTIKDSVFAFDSDEPEEQKRGDGQRKVVHRLIKIGSVVSQHVPTDSVIFEINENIQIDPLAVALSGGEDPHIHNIVLPHPSQVPPALPYGTKVMMFGASRRGMTGYRVQCGLRAEGDYSAMFGVESSKETPTLTSNSFEVEATTTNGTTRLTFGGDCGALYLDEDGRVWCMHTAIRGIPEEDPIYWTSHGACLQTIVNAHPFYFRSIPGLVDSSTLSSSSSYENQCSPVSIQLTKINGPAARGYPAVYFAGADEESAIKFQPALTPDRIPVFYPGELDANNKEYGE